MVDDLKQFSDQFGMQVFQRDTNRLIVYIDNLDKLSNLDKFRHVCSKLTLISSFPIDISFDNILSKPSKFIGYKQMPYDRLVYESLGKGLKEYEYYITPILLLSV